jgi:hypothetical protein
MKDADLNSTVGRAVRFNHFSVQIHIPEWLPGSIPTGTAARNAARRGLETSAFADHEKPLSALLSYTNFEKSS